MEVEARPLMNHLFTYQPPELISSRGDFDVDVDFDTMTALMGYGALPSSASSSRMLHQEVISPALYQSAAACDRILLVNSVDSGLTAVFDNSMLGAPRKRARDPVDYACEDALGTPRKTLLLTVLDQQQSELDRLISQHIDTMRLEIEEKFRWQSIELLAAIQQRIVRKILEKDEELGRVGKLNLALQERIKTLCLENQLLRGLAQTSEAAANSLRINLEHVLAAAHATEDPHICSAVAAVEDEAESCCGSSGGSGQGATEEEQTAARAGSARGSRGSPKRICRGCGEMESCVLLLPCRHLCLCTVCGSARRGCPVCGSVMTGTIRVNMLS